MRPAWRLATNSLSARRSRTILLIATVALSASLIVAVASAMASMHKGIEQRIRATVGAADIRLEHVGKSSFDNAFVEQINAWPETDLVVGRAQMPIPLLNPANDNTAVTTGYGITLGPETRLRPVTMNEGRWLEAPGEIVLDGPAARQLEVSPGDTIEVDKFGEPVELRVVGISEPPPLGIILKPESFVLIETAWRITGKPGRIREIDVVLGKGEDADAVVDAHQRDFGESMLLRVSARLTSGLDKNLRSNELGLILASVIAFLSASFIILTALTTNVTERQRELAILRCVGGERRQLAESQIVVGLIVGGLGAILGVPIGLAGSWAIISQFPEQLPGGFATSTIGVTAAFVGSIVAGLLGAIWPAWCAAKTNPLVALSARAKPATARGVILALVFGLLGVLIHFLIVAIPSNGQIVFWGDVTVGIPSVFAGYFLLAVPAIYAITVVAGPVVRRVLCLPPKLLERTVLATPYRHGFTAGAMMVGLAMLVAIWTNGHAVMRDWIEALDFPDAFANNPNLTEQMQEQIEALPGITETCAVTLQTLGTDTFGVRALNQYNTTFIAFEPAEFFRMQDIAFVEGDKETVMRRLPEGNAIMVAREFNIARGIGAGDTLTLTFNGTPHEFEVIAVVTSPGLDIASKYFDMDKEYVQQSINAVFGTRADLKRLFGNDSISLLQMSLADDADEEDTLTAVRRIAPFSIVGSGKKIKAEILGFIGGTMVIFSTVAVCAMLVACFGVANLIVAGVQARQFELGVLRAVGAQRGLIGRLVLGEAVLIAITACVLGTIMGIQAAWAGQRMYEVLVGLVLKLRPPPLPIAIGWCVLTIITLGAAGPAVWRVMGKSPRELLAAVRG